MILRTDFDFLDIYCVEYGSCVQIGDILKVHIVDGLSVSDDLKSLFSRRYLHDQWKDIKYDKWEMTDGKLRVCADNGQHGSDDWVEYGTSEMANEIMRYEFVGNCWFVFEGVSHFKRMVAEYKSNQKEFTGREIAEEFSSVKSNNSTSKEYILEGALTVPPGPGWMNWRIHAQFFYIELPD